MAKFTSRFPELGFYVDGVLRKFHSGQYVTEDKAEIAILEGLVDTVREEEAEEAPKPKAPAKKSSGK